MALTSYESYDLSRLVTVRAIVSADYIEGPKPAENYHCHQEAWELCVCLAGETLVSKADDHILLEAGQMLFVQPGTYHDIATIRRDTAAFVVSFTCSGGECLLPLRDSLLPADVPLTTLLQNIIPELKATFRQDSNTLHLLQFSPSPTSPVGAEQMICCYLELMLLTIMRQITMRHGQVVPSNQFHSALQVYEAQQITAYIRENLSQRLTIDEIAQHFHYSRARICAVYKAVTGLSLNQRITYERMEQAKVLLLEQTKSVAQISEELGFSSPHYFSHKFTKEVGCPPSRYAATVRSAPEHTEEEG